MIRRGPVLPSRSRFAWLSGMILGAISIATSLVALQNQVVSPLMAVVLPVSASLAGMAIIMASFGILKRLAHAGWRVSEPKLMNWILYLGCLGLAGLSFGVIRGRMMLAIEGPSASEWLLYVELGLCTYGALLVGVVMELQTHFERTALAKRSESRLAVRTLFESREAWILARDRRRDALHLIMAERVEPELAAVHAALASGGRSEATDETLEALCDRLDRLRDAEIRALSHLTHPSIIDIGLQPALRGLARQYRGRLAVTLEADPADLGGLSAPLRLTIYRVVELVLENAAAGASLPMAIRVSTNDDGVTLEVEGSPGAFEVARARQDGRLAVLEARVALHEGSWELLDGDDAGVRVLLPFR
jgi:hypothetical protein